jgi:DNA-binding transcriptional regulator YdaS (Cro superfamily)
MPNYAGDISPTRLRKDVSPVFVRGSQCMRQGTGSVEKS